MGMIRGTPLDSSKTDPEPQLGLSLGEMYLPRKPVAAPPARRVNDDTARIQPDTPPARPPAAPENIPPRPHLSPTMPKLGVLDALLANDTVHDILVNGTQPIYVDTGTGIENAGVRFTTHEEVWKVAEAIMASVGQQWDDTRPMIDTRLPDGSRVNIIAPPMAVDGVSISIRKFPKLRITLESMVANRQLSQEVADFLKAVVASRLNIVIAGGSGTGKTTLLNALSAAIAPNERVVTVEDSAELRLDQPQVVRLESKPPISADAPETGVSIRDLVRNALRMRPDRIIVGESRGAEAFDMLQAMNTGHDGSMTTLHANTARDTLSRLEMMVSLAMPQASIRTVRAQIAGTLHVVIQTARLKGGQRRITQISEIAGMEGETIVMQDLILYRENPQTQLGEYRWVAGSSRNGLITQATQAAGLLRVR